MIYQRYANDRGLTKIGWLDSRHSFSFGDYYDPKFMGFRSLRVINEDWIAPNAGFPTHGHRDMEIITYVIEGAVTHKDSLGNGSTIFPGEVQIMSAGTGIRHSEYNGVKDKPTHLLQIWLLPSRTGLSPRYDQKAFDIKFNSLTPVCAHNGRADTLPIFQDAILYAAKVRLGNTIKHGLSPKRFGWIQVVKGNLTVNGVPLAKGDGAAIEEESELRFTATANDGEFLFFDLA